MRTKGKEKIRNLITKAYAKKHELAGLLATAMVSTPMITHAEEGTDPKNIVKAVIDVVVKIFPLIGGFFVVSGVFKLIMAYRNDQPQEQTAAAKDIVIGAVLIVFAVFAWEPIAKLIF